MITRVQPWVTVAVVVFWATTTGAQKPYRLPDLGEQFNDRIIWGSEAVAPDGFALAFGGQDQVSDDGIGHTRIKEKGGEWQDVYATLRERNVAQVLHDDFTKVLAKHRDLLAEARRLYFQGLPAAATAERFAVINNRINDNLDGLEIALNKVDPDLDALEPGKRVAMTQGIGKLLEVFEPLSDGDSVPLGPGFLSALYETQVLLEQTIDWLGAEPPPRALCPLVYEPKSGLFVLFGGDHLDYLTNDVWVFDPRERTWTPRFTENAPLPRANHQLKASGDGTITLTGGYTYTSNTDYLGGQYIDLDEGPWTYDVVANTWTGKGKTLSSEQRTYRTGPFHPEFYYQPKPEREAHEKVLASLPTNQWVELNPPKLPRLNRDWGTAVLDPDRDLILRYSGGHSAHGGTDVLHYHIATNRWELCYPVEFPLGQLYANTRYPNGFNFNGRPWITGHTYQNYGYDVRLKKMLFSGRKEYTYIYDVDRGDWGERLKKPEPMVYNNCFYTLTHCSTPDGLVCWTKDGVLLRFDAEQREWIKLKKQGEELSVSRVDNSTLTYDSRRERLLFFRKEYGDAHQYSGQIHAYDLKTGAVTTLSPEGMDAAAAISYLCQIRYDIENDLFLVGATLPPDENGLRRTPAYDPVKNRWISLKLTGDDPNGQRGRNVSLGLMYDASRQMYFAVDTNSQVYALKLDLEKADLRPLALR